MLEREKNIYNIFWCSRSLQGHTSYTIKYMLSCEKNITDFEKFEKEASFSVFLLQNDLNYVLNTARIITNKGDI